MRNRKRKEPSAGVARRGRPLTYRPAMRVQAKTVQAIALLAREGAAHRNQLAGLTHPPRKEPEKSSWWGADRLADEIGLGWNASSFNRLATGRYSVSPEIAVRYTATLLRAGLMPPKSFESWPQIAGQGRAMAPFQRLLPHLRSVKAFEVPGPRLRAQIAEAAMDYRKLLREQKEVARDDRGCLRKARQHVVNGLLGLPTRVSECDKSSYCERLDQLACFVSELILVMSSLRGSTWMLVETPRLLFVGRASQLMPTPNSVGEPDFAGLFAWLAPRALAPVPSRSSRLKDFCDRVRARWGVDIGPPQPESGEQPATVEAFQLYETAFHFDWDDRCLDVADDPNANEGDSPPIVPCDVPPELPFCHTLGRTATKDHIRFVTKMWSPLRPHSVHFHTAMAMAERWYFSDQEPEDPETEFCERLSRLGDFAAQAASALSMPSEGVELSLDSQQRWSPWQDRAEAKLLVKELMRLETRPIIEMDLDLPVVSVPSALDQSMTVEHLA